MGYVMFTVAALHFGAVTGWADMARHLEEGRALCASYDADYARYRGTGESAEDLQPLVAGEVLVLGGGMGEGLDRELGILEPVLELGLEMGEELLFIRAGGVHEVPVKRAQIRSGRRGLPMIPGIRPIRGIRSKG